MAGIPFKVCVPSSNVQVGVVARSYEHFRDLLQTKLGLAKDSQVYLEDGTLICDEEYFDLLEPQTKLTIIEPEKKLKVGDKRSMVAPADSVSSLPPAKRSSLTHNKVINSNNNSAFHNNLVHCLRISSVAGSVPMQGSPTHSPNRTFVQNPPLQHLPTSPIHSLCIPPNTFVRNTQPLSHFSLGQQMQGVPQSTRPSLYQQVQPMVLHQGRFQRHRIPVTNPTYVGISHRQPGYRQQTVPTRYDLSCPHQYYLGLPQVSAHIQSPYTSLVHVPENRQAVYRLQPEFIRHSQPQATTSRPRQQKQPPPLYLIPNTDKGASQNDSEALRNTVPSIQESLCLTNPITMGVHMIQPIEQKLDTPICGVTPISEVKQRLSVVACSDVHNEPQSEDTDDEDKLSIIENAEGSTTPVRSGQCSPAFSFSSSKSQSRPSTLSTHSICQENTFAGSECESPISLDEEDTTTTSISKQCDLCSPDDGYSSSSPPQSATDHELTMKLPFADFEGPPQSSTMDEKSDVEVPPTEQELVDVETVDTIEMSGDECLQPQEDHVESPAPLQLVVSVPVQRRDSGRILCQGVKDDERLGISIPVRLSPSGRILCRRSEVKPTEIIVVSDDDEEEGCVQPSKEPTFRTYQSEIHWLESFKKDPLELPHPEIESQDEVSVIEQPPSPPMEHHLDMEQPPSAPMEHHLDMEQPPSAPMEHHSDMEQPPSPPMEHHSDMEQPPSPPMEHHLDMEQPTSPPMEHHSDMEQPTSPPMEHQIELFSTLIEQPPESPMEYQTDLPSPPMFHLLLESPEQDDNMEEESRPQQAVEVPNFPTLHQEPEEEPVVVEDYGCQEHVLTTLPPTKLCTTEEIHKCVQTLVVFAEEVQKEKGVLLVDDDMVFADVEYDVGNEVTVDSLDENIVEDNLVNQIRLENAVPEDEIETEVVDMDTNIYTCDQQNPSGHEIPFICTPLPSASARKALSEGINKLIEVADHLSEEDTAAIKDFFLDGPTKAKGLQKYILQTSSKYVCLELNFDTQEWSGYILAY